LGSWLLTRFQSLQTFSENLFDSNANKVSLSLSQSKDHQMLRYFCLLAPASHFDNEEEVADINCCRSYKCVCGRKNSELWCLPSVSTKEAVENQDFETQCNSEMLSPKYESHLKYILGCEELEHGSMKAALQYYKECIELDGSHVDAHFKMGEIFDKMGAVNTALQYFKKVIALDPENFDAFYILGYIYYRCNDLENALVYFKQASSISQADAATWTNIGLILQELNDLPGSVDANLKAIEIDDLFEMAYFNLGNTYHELKRDDQAIEIFQKLLEINPNHKDAYFNLGVIYQQVGDLDSAVNSYHSALLIDPGFECAHEAKDSLQGYLVIGKAI